MSPRETTPEEADDHYSEYGDCTQQDVWIAQKVERETARLEAEAEHPGDAACVAARS